jgi:hypothetical protein
MPLDPMFTEPMLGPFRGMMQEVDGKGLAGPNVDEMRAQLTYMEELAQQISDIAAYTGKLAQENTFQKFSDAYSRALTDAAQEAQADVGTSDDALLEQALGAYDGALQTYRDGGGGDQTRPLIPYVERIVEIGRSGVSYPVFLRMVEEEGLNKVLEGSAPSLRPALEKSLQIAQAGWLRWSIERAQRELAVFEEIAQRSAFGQPDPLELSLANRRIEWELAPSAAHWDAKVRRWQYMLDLLRDWVDSFAKFAPYDPRWRTPGASEATVRKNIARTQECGPGRFRYREALYQRYFHQGWEEIWRDETFVWEYTARRVEWSEERLQLIRATYPHCQPGAKPPAELVARAEQLQPNTNYRPDQNVPPPWGTPLQSPPL